MLVYFLGMCSFLSVSTQLKTSLGLGLAVTFVLTITSALNYIVVAFDSLYGVDGVDYTNSSQSHISIDSFCAAIKRKFVIILSSGRPYP